MAAAANSMYQINDLKMNMRVRVSQLKNILDTFMILTDSKRVEGDDVEGTLVYFGEGEDDEAAKWFMQSEKGITPVFFDSEEVKEGIVYDE